MKNIIYLKHILSIGGVETYVYELAKKYGKDYEITVFYDTADPQQLRRLQRYINCQKFEKTRRYQCEVFITNYDIEMINYVDAKQYIEVIHANFMNQKELTPHIHQKITKYIAVSKENAKAWTQRTGLKCDVCPNPLTYEQQEYRPLFLMAAQRMSKEKGVERIKALVDMLDNDKEIKYTLLIFTTQNTSMYSLDMFESDNVIIKTNCIDIRHLTAACDGLLVLSDTEGRSYTASEKLASGHGKLIATPLPVLKEMGSDKKNTITLEFDMSNIKEVVEQLRAMYKSNPLAKDFKPVEVKDKWNKILAKGKSEYKPIKYVMCRATDQWQKKNLVLSETNKMPKENEILTLTEQRYEELHNSKIFNCCLVTDKKVI